MRFAPVFKRFFFLGGLHPAFFHYAAAGGVFLEIPRLEIGIAHLKKRIYRRKERLARIASVPMLRSDLTPALKARDRSP